VGGTGIHFTPALRVARAKIVWCMSNACKYDSMIRFDQGPQVSAQAGYSSEDDLSAKNSRLLVPIPDEGDSRSGNSRVVSCYVQKCLMFRVIVDALTILTSA